MEENYAFRGVYLVDTGRLGSGLTRAESATVQRFPISEYLRNLEAVAFVPDLTDDAYLGILLMGSQNRRIQACRIPLGDSSKPVRCRPSHRILPPLAGHQLDAYHRLVATTAPQSNFHSYNRACVVLKRL